MSRIIWLLLIFAGLGVSCFHSGRMAGGNSVAGNVPLADSSVLLDVSPRLGQVAKTGETIPAQINSNVTPVQYTYRVINSFPHDTGAYTQGLFIRNGYLFESTGQGGQSSVRKVKLHTGEMVRAVNNPDTVFGEGLCFIKGHLVQITWRSKIAYIYDTTLRLLKSVPYSINEGWGLTTDGENLIMSDGSATLYFLGKENFTIVKKIEVADNNGPVDQLNELEFIGGKIWANVFTSDTVVQIDPRTGIVTGQIDFAGITAPYKRPRNMDVLNGIAYDSVLNRIFITGKNWPKVFEVSIHQK